MNNSAEPYVRETMLMCHSTVKIIFLDCGEYKRKLKPQQLKREDFNSLSNWVYDYGWEVLNGVSVAFLGVIKIFFAQNNIWIWLALIAALLGYIWSFVELLAKKKRLSTLEDEVENANQAEKKKSKQIKALSETISKYQEGYKDLIQAFLTLISDRLKLTINERISIYEHDSNYFQLLCRYSENVAFCDPGRHVYPDDEGYIAKGFHENVYQKKDLPDPEEDHDKYFEASIADTNFKKSVSKKLRMKSRSYCSCSVANPVTKDKVAVVVIESLQPDFEIYDEYKHIHPEVTLLINSYLQRTSDVRPNASFAKNMGL